jgi:hypothetical protein
LPKYGPGELSAEDIVSEVSLERQGSESADAGGLPADWFVGQRTVVIRGTMIASSEILVFLYDPAVKRRRHRDGHQRALT